MTSHTTRAFAVAFSLTLAACNNTATTAEKPATPDKGYAALNALPDWSGGWGDAQWDRGRGGRDGSGYGNTYPLKPEAKEKFLAVRKIAASGGETNLRLQTCQQPRFAGTMGGPESYAEFLFTPGRVTITDEGLRLRRIYTDGRAMPTDPGETFMGFSVGHWEGQTLVVETAGLDRANMPAPMVEGGMGMHTEERIYLKEGDPDTMIIDSVVYAPDVFTEPYKVTKQYVRHKNYTMIPFDCGQNNRDIDKDGHQQFDLTPPPDLPPPPKD